MSTFHYTATIFLDKTEIAHESGNDLEELYNWMLINSQGKFGNIHGSIIDNKTHKPVKAFRKSPPD